MKTKKYLFSLFFSNWGLCAFVFLWIAWQFCYVYHGYYDELISDPGFYVYYATECVNHGTIYPDYSNYHDEYIFNSGYINFLVLIIKLTGSTKIVPYLNVLFNVCIVLLTIWLCKILNIPRKTTLFIIYCFIALPSYTTIVLHLYTEQLFVIFLLLSLCFTLQCKIHYTLGAGVFAAIAIWIRPVALAWIIGSVLLFLFKRHYALCITYLLSYAFVCSTIAIATHANFPDYIYKAETGGVNMIMGANDLADGGYCGDARRNPKGLGYLEGRYDTTHETRVKFWFHDTTYVKRFSEKYTYKQYDSIYKSRAISWIVANPEKWIKLSHKKIKHTFNQVPSFLFSYGGNSLSWPFRIYSRYINYNITYVLWIIMLLFSVLSIFLYKKDIIYICLLFLPLILYVGMIVVTCGASRYNVITHPFLTILACQTIVTTYRYHLSLVTSKYNVR